ncbi:unnamed protein product, partial [Rotaria sordida]
DQTESVEFSSILIKIDGFEIEIRRPEKPTHVRSASVTYQQDNHQKKTKAEEKLKISQSYWDYSTLY